jgi:hypothetical protein
VILLVLAFYQTLLNFHADRASLLQKKSIPLHLIFSGEI